MLATSYCGDDSPKMGNSGCNFVSISEAYKIAISNNRVELFSTYCDQSIALAKCFGEELESERRRSAQRRFNSRDQQEIARRFDRTSVVQQGRKFSRRS